MQKIKQEFANLFPEVEFPVQGSIKGAIQHHNTIIRYLFGQDAQARSYLDVYSKGRMGTLHLRIYYNGETEALETYQEGFTYDSKILGDEERAEQAYREHNERVGKLLLEKFY